jgi:hypothetical protein
MGSGGSHIPAGTQKLLLRAPRPRRPPAIPAPHLQLHQQVVLGGAAVHAQHIHVAYVGVWQRGMGETKEWALAR